jgi:hypothetical protein
MSEPRVFRAERIYKAKRGHIYDQKNPRYNCYRPAETGKWNVFDVWVCDGNIHPGYNASPVPVTYHAIGKEVTP